MTRRWLLDDGPFHTLARHFDLVDLERWPRDTFLVSDATRRRANENAERTRILEGGGGAPVSTFEVMVDSEAATIVYQHLRKNEAMASANLAEHECIAYALAEAPDAIFVADDKQAAFLALAELGRGRVAHPTELWHHLWTERLIDGEGLSRLMRSTLAKDQSLPAVPWRFRTGLNRDSGA